MCDVHVRFTNGSAARSTLAVTRYVFHVHSSFATGIVLCSLFARRYARPAAFATAPHHRSSHAPINCAAVGAARIGARSPRALFARIQKYRSGSSLRRAHRKLITRWPESRRALLESGEHDSAVARAESLCACAKNHHAERGHRRSVTGCERETSRHVARSRARATWRLEPPSPPHVGRRDALQPAIANRDVS
jgi:hypothetical protein